MQDHTNQENNAQSPVAEGIPDSSGVNTNLTGEDKASKASNKTNIIMAIIVTVTIAIVLATIAILLTSGQGQLNPSQGQNSSGIDAQFKEYILDNYGIKVNDDGYINRCYSECDYYGYYNVGNDYNYAIQISNTGNEFEASVDTEAIKAREELYNYISDVRGNDIAPNYLGYYKNTDSGIISYSSGDSQKLYYIVRYRDDMRIDEELYKDYQILQKAQDLLPLQKIKEMNVIYVDDAKLNDEDWVKKLGLDTSQYGDIIYDADRLFDKNVYSYRISDYKSGGSLADKTFYEFLSLVKSNEEK